MEDKFFLEKQNPYLERKDFRFVLLESAENATYRTTCIMHIFSDMARKLLNSNLNIYKILRSLLVVK